MMLKSKNPAGDDWWNKLSESEVESINQGLKDFEEGKIHGHDEALRIYGKYL